MWNKRREIIERISEKKSLMSAQAGLCLHANDEEKEKRFLEDCKSCVAHLDMSRYWGDDLVKLVIDYKD
jgi:hypothetical protein